MNNLDTLKANAKNGMDAFWAFDKAFADGAVDAKTRQLIAVAVALTTQCPYCIERHKDAARQAGADDAERAETGVAAAASRAGGAITHATHLFDK